MLSFLPFPPTSKKTRDIDALVWSRRLVKTMLARTVAPFLRADTPLVLGYHRVVEECDAINGTTLPGMLVSLGMLERHLDAVGRVREFVTLDDLGRSLVSGRRFRKPVAAVTFDDGYRDVYEHAWPLLKRKGIPAAVFLVTNLVGTARPHVHDLVFGLLVRATRDWNDPAEELRRIMERANVPARRRGWLRRAGWTATDLARGLLTTLPRTQLMAVLELLQNRFKSVRSEARADAMTMSWEMVSEMRRGGMVIGSHTCSHVLLANENRARMIEELTASRRVLEHRLDSPIEHFAYPNGSFNQSVVHAVAAAGYRFGYTTCPHQETGNPCLTIPRRLLWEQSSVDSSGQFSAPILNCQTSGLLTGRPTCTWDSHA